LKVKSSESKVGWSFKGIPAFFMQHWRSQKNQLLGFEAGLSTIRKSYAHISEIVSTDFIVFNPYKSN